MDLTLPYTLYPTVLPHWLAWVFFLFVILGTAAAVVAVFRNGELRLGLIVCLPILVALWVSTLIVSMILAFVIDW